jgi:predicted extracellular nuclease
MAAGDIALVRYSADGTTKPFSFVILADLSGQTIFFTDNGWTAAGGFRTGEGVVSYVVPANTPIGTVVSLSISGNFNPSGTGDAILAYTGTTSAPNFLFAVDFADNNATYAGDATNSNTSAVPTGLSFGETALAFGLDNAAYDGPLTGTREEILANIADETRWIQDDANNVAAPSNFTITPSGTVSVTIGDVSVTEGDAGTSVATFTVTRSDASTAFAVDFATLGDTATANDDFDTASGTLTFDVGGALTQTVSVTINGDAVIEPTERFTVQLANLVQTSGATELADATATGTIVNDDLQIIFIHDVQGSAFFSPIVRAEGITAFNQATTSEVTVRGVVTAIDTFGSVQGFYVSEEVSDWDMSALTSEGIFVRTTAATAGLTVGETVTVTAKVTEFQDARNLNRTMLTAPSIITQGDDSVPLPTFTIDGTAGHRIPTSIVSDDSPDFRDSDGSSGTFDPENDALDFYETLEGMRVTVTNMVVGDGFVSGNENFASFQAYSLDNADPNLVNSRGGYTITGDPEFYPVDTATPDDDVKFGGATVHDGATHGDFLEIDFGNVGRGGTAGFDELLTMGDSLGDVTGIIDFDATAVKLFVTDALDADKVAALGATTPIQEVTQLVGDDRSLRIASFNVENLSPVGTTFSTNNGTEITTQEKYDKLAANIADNLLSPDIIIVEEVQDNNGVGGGGVTDASQTFEQLIAAVNAATGKTYQWVDEAPAVANTVGGAPGGNIRVGFLYDTARVQLGDLAADATLEDRRAFTDRIGDGVRDAGDRIAVDDSMVAGIDPADWAGTRRSLMGQFTFNGQTVFAVGSHLPSKGGSGEAYQIDQDNDAGQPANGGWADRNQLAQDLWSVQNLVATAVPEAKLVSGGDFNEFWYNRPLEVLTGYANPNGTANTDGARYVNLMVQELTAAERFSYDFDGRSQALDTIVADQALAAVASFDVVHINTGFNERPGAFNPASSDHDPTLASFDFRSFDETLRGAGIDDALDGFGGDDLLVGGAGNDLLSGGEGDDVLNGGAGRDRLDGGAGSDLVSYATADAGVTANLRNARANTGEAAGDTYLAVENLAGSDFADVLSGDGGDNAIAGGAGDDVLVGGLGADRLFGGIGSDRMTGGDGDDRIGGGAGNDTASGGAGTDRFFFLTLGDISTGDRITDFRRGEGDRIDLGNVLAEDGSGEPIAFSYIGSGDFTGDGGPEVRVQQFKNGRSVVQFDTNSDGAVDHSFLVISDQPLNQGDFILIGAQ